MRWNYIPTKTKYKNDKVVVDGISYDSRKEANRYQELLILEKLGEITELKRQVSFKLLPTQKINGKVVERSVNYVADFTYLDADGQYIVEDTKGFKTKDYIMKRKLMLYIHGIKITET